MSNKFAVQAGDLSPEIYIGKVGKDGKSFVTKEAQTDMVLASVGLYAARHFGGGMAATFPDLNMKIEIRVAPLVPHDHKNGVEQ